MVTLTTDLPISALVFDFNQVLWNSQQLNTELLMFLNTLPSTFTLAIFSSSLILKNTDLQSQLMPPFSRIFISKDLGFSKSDPAAYQHIAQLLTKHPTELVFIDDQLLNVEAAQAVQLHAVQFQSNADLFAHLKRLLSLPPASQKSLP